ncbi:MAG: glycosyl transferase group 1 [Chlamydiales bacterium]|jgi:tetratricopeptide (TPR) repeat protein|nr:glycosyl transferase group 1 [Chlamydiales bacterium]
MVDLVTPLFQDAIEKLNNHKLDDAELGFLQCIAKDSSCIQAYNNLGLIARLKKDIPLSNSYLSKSLKVDPNNTKAILNLGKNHLISGQSLEAKQYYQKVIDIYQSHDHSSDSFSEAYKQLGHLAKKDGLLEQAEIYYKQALELKPDMYHVYNCLGEVFARKNNFLEAKLFIEKALALSPQYASAYSNLGIVLQNLGEYKQAILCYQKAIELNPDLAVAHNNLGMLQILCKNFSEGWKEYEWRLIANNLYISDREIKKPIWRGEDLNGKTLLIRAEQGYGDTIQFIRYIKLFEGINANIIVEVQPPLKELLQYNFTHLATFIEPSDSLAEIDYHVALLSLPFLFDTRLENIPNWQPYLQIPPIKQTLLVNSNCEYKPRIGFAWTGNSQHTNNKNRSCPLNSFLKIFKSFNGLFYSLQVGLIENELAKESYPNVMDLTSKICDFTDTAQLIQQLDLVICVDTATAHLAAALGKPTWILLPYFPDWRWFLGQNDSPWYGSARLFRQSSIGNWDSVFEEILYALKLVFAQD